VAEALLKVLGNPIYASSGSDWKPGLYRNGFSALSLKQSYQWSVSKPGICRQY
jgi:hypothetical protein